MDFAAVYGKDRANECNDIPGDQYNRSWPYGCKDRGLTDSEYNDIKNNPGDNVDHESLQEQNRRDCYDEGFEDGNNSNSFNKDRDSACSEYGSAYEGGFSAGCQSVEGNTNDSCELTIEGHEIYCPDNTDDPAYKISVIKNHFLLRAVQFVTRSLITLAALKLLILKDIVSLLMIQHFADTLL